ncbi:hypothetical protein BG015_002354 [Linnemannia schmuckeri]|uniref:Arm-like repeat domain-containing protein n=1 Tax=Linnemannia schmuckeri TaxID=64567 RepID=A0A9P5RS25_9FUNG|nr:hypothetical protein BG015_002354 [Linnemannia schmuckeri]
MNILKNPFAKANTSNEAQKPAVKILSSKQSPLRLSPGIFPQNLGRPVVQAALPHPGARIDNTAQLVFCNQLLSNHYSSSSPLDMSPMSSLPSGLPSQSLSDHYSSSISLDMGPIPSPPSRSPNDSVDTADVHEDNSVDAQEVDPLEDWLQTMERDPIEQKRLRWMPTRLVEEFANDVTNKANAIAEVALLGPILDRETYRDLLGCFLSKFERALMLKVVLLDVDLLQGLVQLVQSASPGYLVNDDVVRTLKILQSYLDIAKPPISDEKNSGLLDEKHSILSDHRVYLTIAVSRVLGVMVEGMVQELDRSMNHSLLRDRLQEFRLFDNPHLRFQVAYAYQALQHIPDGYSALQTIMIFASGLTMAAAGSASGSKIDPQSLVKGIGNIHLAVSQANGVAKSMREGTQEPSFAGDDNVAIGKLVQSFATGQKRAWYLALQGAQALVRNGQLADFKTALSTLACRHERDFQWGVCQLLGEIILDPFWDTSTHQQTIDCLGELYISQGWGNDVSVKKWILTILQQVSDHPNPNISRHSEELLQNLKKDGNVEFEGIYPLRARLPLPTDSPLLAIVQKIPLVNLQLNKLRSQRLVSLHQTVYIPPQAFLSLKSSTKRTFPLLEKVQEFLNSDQHVFLILGDSGSGKSTFNSFLERDLLTKYRGDGRFPLYINLPAIEQPESNMIAKLLLSYDFTEVQIQELKEHYQFVLICDGYDESHLVTNLYMKNQLNSPGSWNVKMIISCRSSYVGPHYLDQFRPQAANPYRYHSNAHSLFQEAAIAPFSPVQIKEYVEQFVEVPEVKKQFGSRPVWAVSEYMEKLSAIPNLMDLVKNPFLLSITLRILPDVVKDVLDLSKIVVTRLDLYNRFVDQWLTVNKVRIQNSRLSAETRSTFQSIVDDGFEANVICYLKKLASAIFKEQNGNPVVRYSHYKDKDTWKAEFFSPEGDAQIFRDASPLSRTGLHYQFIHGSLLEYFYSRDIVNQDGEQPPPTLSRPQSLNRSNNRDSDVSSDWHSSNPHTPQLPPTAFRHAGSAVDPSSAHSLSRSSTNPFRRGPTDFSRRPPISPFEPRQPHGPARRLSSAFMEELPDRREYRDPQTGPFIDAPNNLLGGRLSERNLTKDSDALYFLSEQALADPKFKQELFMMIERSKTQAQASPAAANAMSILIRAGVRFNGMDLRGIRVSGADLSGGEFDSAFLQGADMTDVNLSSIWLRQANLNGATLTGVQFGEARYLLESFSVHSCGVSPDAKKLALGCSDGTIRIYNGESLEWLYTIFAHSAAVTSLAFSPRVQEIASASEGTSINLWDTKDGQRGPELARHTNRITCLCYSPSGKLMASGSWDKTVRLWHAVKSEHRSANQPGHVLVGHENCVTSISFSPNDREIASGSWDMTVRLWDVNLGTVRAVIKGHTDWVLCVAYSPTGGYIASGSQDGTVRLLDALVTDSSRFIWTGHTDAVTSVTFSLTGKQVVTGSKDNTVRMWDPDTGVPGAVFRGHSGAITTLAYSPQGRTIISGSVDKSVRFWDSNSQAVLRGGDGHADAVSGVAYSSNGLRVVSGSHDHTVRIWNAETGAPVSVLRGHTGKVRAVAFSPTGAQVASGGEDKTLRLWSVTDAKEEFVLRRHSEAVTAVAFTPNGKRLASGSEDNTILVFDCRTGERLLAFKGHTLPVSSLSFSSTGHLLVSASWDNTVRFWIPQAGASSTVWTCHEEAMSAVAFVPPKCAWLVTGSKDNTARVWDLSTATTVYVLSGHKQPVESVSVSPCGRVIATGSQDGKVCLWVAATGRPLAVMSDFFGGVNSIAWKPSSNTFNSSELEFVTGCGDKSVRVWKIVGEGSGGGFRVKLVWGSTYGGLVLSGAVFENTTGLSWSQAKLVTQRGGSGADVSHNLWA